MKEFYINLIAGIGLGFVFVFLIYALCVGFDREYERQVEMKECYCEVYGVCE